MYEPLVRRLDDHISSAGSATDLPLIDIGIQRAIDGLGEVAFVRILASSTETEAQTLAALVGDDLHAYLQFANQIAVPRTLVAEHWQPTGTGHWLAVVGVQFAGLQDAEAFVEVLLNYAGITAAELQ